MRYGDQTWTEVRDLAAARAVALVPLGCTEQQSTHLPVDFDSWFAEELAVAAATSVGQRGVRAVVTPVLPFGPTPEHRNFGAGFVDLPARVRDAVVEAILRSLVDQGFRAILVLRGCGGDDLRGTIGRQEQEWSGRIVFDLPDPPFADIWARCGGAAVPAGHADSFTTSICLYRRPEVVRRDRLPRVSDAPDWSDPNLDFARYSVDGTIGDASAASAQMGERLWSACGEWLADRILSLAYPSA